MLRPDLYEHLCKILQAQLLLCQPDDPIQEEPFIQLLLHDINIVMNEV